MKEVIVGQTYRRNGGSKKCMDYSLWQAFFLKTGEMGHQYETDPKVMGCEGVNWIELAKDYIHSWAVVLETSYHEILLPGGK